jgi:cytochrome P450
VWIVDRYADVLSGLRDDRLSTGYVEPGFREAAGAALASMNLTLDDQLFGNRSGEIDLIAEVARPWARGIAFTVTGLSGDKADALAFDIFASAQNPCDTELRLRCEQATIELARQFDGVLQAFWVQTFVALSQSLPAFLGNSWLELLENSVMRIDSIRDATEELLRYAGPSLAQLRTAAVEISLAGQRIEKGDRVALMLANANRDAEVFSDPNQLDLGRRPNPHLAFGAGAHACIGATLIRRASTVAIAHFMENFANAQLLDVKITEGFALRAVTSLVVQI